MILMPSEREPSPELRWLGRKTARSPPEAVTLKFPCKYIRSPDEPLTAISETSDEVSKRPRGILPGSYTVHSLELDAAIAWGGVGVVAGVVTSITGGCFATGGGVGVVRAGSAWRGNGVGDALARSGVAETSGVGVATTRSGVATGSGVGKGEPSFTGRGFSTRMRC